MYYLMDRCCSVPFDNPHRVIVPRQPELHHRIIEILQEPQVFRPYEEDICRCQDMRVVAGFETVELLFISLEKAFGYHEERAFQHQLRCGRREKNSLGVNPLRSPVGCFPEWF